jgi:hypothetical protein
MRYWWVNQNQTFRQEIAGGYCWSPKRNANGARYPFYEFMREASPGDLVFSFADTKILAIGTVQSYCFESLKRLEFGSTGQNWENIGWPNGLPRRDRGLRQAAIIDKTTESRPSPPTFLRNFFEAPVFPLAEMFLSLPPAVPKRRRPRRWRHVLCQQRSDRRHHLRLPFLRCPAILPKGQLEASPTRGRAPFHPRASPHAAN